LDRSLHGGGWLTAEIAVIDEGERVFDPQKILSAWPNIHPEIVQQTTAGANNVSYHIETPTG